MIQWVAEPAPGVTPLTVEPRLDSKFFKSEKTMKVENWTSDIHPDSLVAKRAFADPSLASVKPGYHFQFERVSSSAANLIPPMPLGLTSLRVPVEAESTLQHIVKMTSLSKLQIGVYNAKLDLAPLDQLSSLTDLDMTILGDGESRYLCDPVQNDRDAAAAAEETARA